MAVDSLIWHVYFYLEITVTLLFSDCLSLPLIGMRSLICATVSSLLQPCPTPINEIVA